jgi:lipid II:glycine glycyltransferase (peptidoglycan interpeptide bridge formation enzyme)
MLTLDPVSRDIWDEVARACPWATYFHTAAWAGCMAATFSGFTAEALGCALADGTPVVLPCVVKKKKRLLRQVKNYKSMEPGVYGGFMAPRLLAREEIDLLAAAVLRIKGSSGRIVETPWQPLNLPASFISKKISTHIVALNPDFETLQKTFSRGQKSNLSQARRKQVTVRRAATGIDIDAYFSLYTETVKRWGETAGAIYSKELFVKLFAAKDPHIIFTLAEVEGRIAAGIIAFAWGSTIIYWHGAALQEYFKHYPNNLLHAELMAWGCANGYQVYDMGPSAGLEGVARFKESFGAQAQDFRSYRWK